MNKWKFGFFVMLTISIAIVLFQQFRIIDLKWKKEELSDILKRVDQDLNVIRNCLLISDKKEIIIDKIRKSDPTLVLFEYDLGSVKMRGLDLIFDKNNKITSIASQVY